MPNIIQYCLLYLNMEGMKNESKIEKIELTREGDLFEVWYNQINY